MTGGLGLPSCGPAWYVCSSAHEGWSRHQAPLGTGDRPRGAGHPALQAGTALRSEGGKTSHPTGCLRFHGKHPSPDIYGKCIHGRKFTRYRKRPCQPRLRNRVGFHSSRWDSWPSGSKVPHLRTRRATHETLAHEALRPPGLWSLRALDLVPGRYEGKAVVPGCHGNDPEGSVPRLLNCP